MTCRVSRMNCSPILIVVSEDEEVCAKSFRNIVDVSVQTAEATTVREIVQAASLVVTGKALDLITTRAVPGPALVRGKS